MNRGTRHTTSVKVVITGGFGKTSFISAVSEIALLATEDVPAGVAGDVEVASGKRRKATKSTKIAKIKKATTATSATTTAAVDFGRVSLDGDLILHLFATPGEESLWFLWDDLCRGAVGAVVLVDSHRLADCLSAIDYFEDAGLPYVVVQNDTGDVPGFETDKVRDVLGIGPQVPVVNGEAGSRESAKAALMRLVEHAMSWEAHNIEG